MDYSFVNTHTTINPAVLAHLPDPRASARRRVATWRDVQYLTEYGRQYYWKTELPPTQKVNEATETLDIVLPPSKVVPPIRPVSAFERAKPNYKSPVVIERDEQTQTSYPDVRPYPRTATTAAQADVSPMAVDLKDEEVQTLELPVDVGGTVGASHLPSTRSIAVDQETRPAGGIREAWTSTQDESSVQKQVYNN